MVYFTINNEPTLTSSVYIGAAVDLDPNTIYVGQLQFNTGNSLPTASNPSPGSSSTRVYGYQNTSSTNSTITSRSFGLINYVLKIPPSSLYGYNFQTSRTFLLDLKLVVNVNQREISWERSFVNKLAKTKKFPFFGPILTIYESLIVILFNWK